MIVLSPADAARVDRYLDEKHEHFARLGQELFEVFGYDKNKNQVNTQIRNLQQVACSATRFADIEDFVKNQMGKEKLDTDRQPKWKRVGPSLLDALVGLREWSKTLEGMTAEQKFAARLRLARGWVRALVGEYLYRVALDQMGVRNGHDA